MSDLDHFDEVLPEYVPIRGVSGAYEAVSQLDEAGLEGLCPSFHELRQQDADRYEEQVFIGRGALKDVYKTFDQRVQRSVAMARLREDRGPEFFDHFVNESWIVASLNHPNIIKIFDVGVDESNRPYYTMDLKSNRTLQGFREGAMAQDLTELLSVFIKVCDAVAYAHSKGVIHLDLKPDNIQCDAYGDVLVCDWGLAKVLDGELFEAIEASSKDLVLDHSTLLGQVKGSLGYMAPEQLDGTSNKDVYTDVYALGCMLHFILTGKPPYTGTKEEIFAATKQSKVEPLRASYPEVHIPKSLEAVVMKATRLDPDQRYASVTDLQQEIQNYLAGYSTEAEESGFFREAKLFFRRNRLPSVIIAVALVVLGVASVLFIQEITEHRLAVEEARVRADQLGVSLDRVHSRFDSWLEESETSKKELAADLAYTSSNVKNLGILKRPVSTVNESQKLARMALQLDSTQHKAYLQLFVLNCLKLNYEVAVEIPLRMPEPLDEKYGNYYNLAEAFPEFDFSSEHRPSVPQLVDFLQRAYEVNANCGRHLHRVLAFDYAARVDDLDGYHLVVEAFLQYLHDGAGHLKLDYDTAARSLTLWTDQPLHLYEQRHSLLRFLKIQTLRLETDQLFELAQLEGLDVEILDLRGCDRVSFGPEKVNLLHLQQIIVRPGQSFNGDLSRWIEAGSEFEIVEQ